MDIEIDPKLCFVLMPMREEFIELYEDVIKPTVTEVGLTCLYADELFGPRSVMEDVWEYCARARVVIAELTGRNSNVYYEAGYSHAFDRGKVIFIAQNMDEVTFDIRHFRCIVYNTRPRGISDLKKRLKKNIEAVLAEEPQSGRVITRTVEVPVEVPAPLDERMREALKVYKIIEAAEQGQAVLADERVARLRKVLEEVSVVEPEDLPPRVTIGVVDFVLIPPGEFSMGSDKGFGFEKPALGVYLDAFYIGKYPLTNAQYKHFLEATGHRAPRHWSGGAIPRAKENHPVVNVDWYSARRYCQWLAEETDQVIRLATEAEWEKAARGTDGREYPWGSEFDKDKCNTSESEIGATTPVGRYSPEGDSPYEVADMAGNVWEWTSSLWSNYPYDPDDGREDPEAGGSRVLRGGAFSSNHRAVRCAFRYRYNPDSRSDGVGFRVVVSPGFP